MYVEIKNSFTICFNKLQSLLICLHWCNRRYVGVLNPLHHYIPLIPFLSVADAYLHVVLYLTLWRFSRLHFV